MILKKDWIKKAGPVVATERQSSQSTGNITNATGASNLGPRELNSGPKYWIEPSVAVDIEPEQDLVLVEDGAMTKVLHLLKCLRFKNVARHSPYVR